MKGWIKLHRKLLENPIWEDPHYLKLWIYCLMKATHKEREVILGNQIIVLQPGEFITGRKALSEDLNKGTKPKLKLNESTWWRYLNNLGKLQMLNIKKTNKYSVVTILNWNEYQENEQQTNNKRTSDEQQMNTNKNDKNDKNIKESIPYAEIVDYLNQKAGKKYQPTTQKTKTLIKARWNEGFKLNDFKKVIDIKTSQWKHDEKMNKYLRPETLFGSKFESYLNESPPEPERTDIPQRRTIDFSEGEDWI